MGDPKKPRKKYDAPRNPWQSDQLSQELWLVGTYGLRNKHELWKAQTKLSIIRKQARMTLAETAEGRDIKESILVKSLSRIGIIESESSLDDVLTLTIEDLLSRRLQTIVWKKGLAITVYQARQMITHGHISIKNRKITRPGYIVKSDEDQLILIREGSPYKEKIVASPSG